MIKAKWIITRKSAPTETTEQCLQYFLQNIQELPLRLEAPGIKINKIRQNYTTFPCS